MEKIERVGDSTDLLGESVVWNPVAQSLHWVDAMGGQLRTLRDGRVHSVAVPVPLGTLILGESGALILALTDGFYSVDPVTGATQPLATLTGLDPAVRMNDGKVDRQGRLICGTLDTQFKSRAGEGRYYMLGGDRRFQPFQEGVGVTNGPCFSPDGRYLYIADSALLTIWRYACDPVTGLPGDREKFADESVLGGMPDGATVDAQGHMWVALVTSGEVVRLTPDGAVARRIAMPVRCPTSVAFGGADLDTLYVTSLSKSPNFAATEEGAGGLFALTGLGVRGIAERPWAIAIS